MKTIETKIGQVFEIWENRKEAIHDIVDIIDGIRFAIETNQRTDETLYIRYKDGSHYFIGEEGEEGKFRKTNIETIIDENPCTTMVYGKYRIYNIDDIDETYSPENDDDEKFWNVDEVA